CRIHPALHTPSAPPWSRTSLRSPASARSPRWSPRPTAETGSSVSSNGPPSVGLRVDAQGIVLELEELDHGTRLVFGQTLVRHLEAVGAQELVRDRVFLGHDFGMEDLVLHPFRRAPHRDALEIGAGHLPAEGMARRAALGPEQSPAALHLRLRDRRLGGAWTGVV